MKTIFNNKEVMHDKYECSIDVMLASRDWVFKITNTAQHDTLSSPYPQSIDTMIIIIGVVHYDQDISTKPREINGYLNDFHGIIEDIENSISLFADTLY